MTEDEMIAVIRQLPAALAERDADAITDILGALIAVRAGIGERWRGFAQVLLRQGEIDMAAQAYDLLAAQTPQRGRALFEKAAALADKERIPEAYAIVAGLSDGAIDTVQRAHFLGVAASQLGRFDEARAHFLAALAIDRSSGPTWHALALIVDLADNPDLADRLIAARPDVASTNEAHLATYLYAIGKMHDDRGAHEQAFAAVEEAGALLARSRPYDASADRLQADAIIAEPPGRIDAGDGGDGPIFVLGFPRSGTTLVQQILARHPAVGGGGEAGVFGIIAERLGGLHGGIVDRWASRQSDPDAATAGLRRCYRHLLAQRYPGGGRNVDKSLGNTRYLGLIAAVLPDAPLIWIRRDPLDVAWSNLRTFFPFGMEWSLSQVDLAAHMAIEDRLFEYWRRQLGDRLLILNYEQLVAAPADSTDLIYRHCGLDTAVAARKPVSAAIATASFASARGGISQTAIGTARPHRKFLRPFSKHYAALGGMLPD